jgi:integrase
LGPSEFKLRSSECNAIVYGFLFRQLLKSGRALSASISPWTVWNTVVTAAQAASINHLGPHDLRRSAAKFCRKAEGDIEQIQKLLGREDIPRTDFLLCSEIQNRGGYIGTSTVRDSSSLYGRSRP